MILIGMYDSPFVRRVAISLSLLGMTFEHRNWSVGKDADKIREFHPQGRVPVLVLDDGEALTESALIVDWLDRLPGREHRLLPATDPQRRDALKLIALAVGALDKGILLVYERLFRPVEMHHEPWLQRCRKQSEAALAELDRICRERADREWLVGDTISQADIMLTCAVTYLRDAVPFDLAAMPALKARVDGYEAQSTFKQFYAPFDAPKTN
ncbi:MAG: glutathione S-transferase family protein [Proteobacteria bacterium]|nr:glutathione S-transferase family protein [Pseudomonadota bacterium]